MRSARAGRPFVSAAALPDHRPHLGPPKPAARRTRAVRERKNRLGDRVRRRPAARRPHASAGRMHAAAGLLSSLADTISRAASASPDRGRQELGEHPHLLLQPGTGPAGSRSVTPSYAAGHQLIAHDGGFYASSAGPSPAPLYQQVGAAWPWSVSTRCGAVQPSSSASPSIVFCNPCHLQPRRSPP